ncbi:hypothetical protein [Prevotella communis]|uniref:hypothetical protein n=1 Tax=Prevotella communis TaxID=2913614 RepID=UPI001EDA937D|nr:hypothetical protein [Prevotella communis]UKK56814.1 hypothetical protein L6476_00730 [Prevotella communis]
MFISLYTSRVVLDKLGIEDFGINNVVAGFVTMLAFFSSSLSNVTQRFLNIELGRGDIKRAREVFNQHQVLYCIIIAIVVILAETAGLWFVKNKLVIPSERIGAAIWAYHFAVISLSFTLFGIVYNAAIIAHEQMKIYSVVGIAEGILKLLIALILSSVHSDRLIVYSFLLMMVVALTQLFYAGFCHVKYKECRFLRYWDKTTVASTFSFIGWNFVGTLIYMLKGQGLNVLLNMYFGPVVNAARAVTSQVNGAISNFNANFFKSVQPQIVKSYAIKDMDRVKSLFFSSTKYSLFILWILDLPIALNISFLLGIWLKEVPDYTEIFTILVLTDSLLSTLTDVPWVITMASGKLKKYVLWSNSILLLIFPLAFIVLELGASPVAPLVVVIGVRILQIISVLRIVNGQIHYGIGDYINNVIKPFLYVVGISLPLCYFVKFLLGDAIFLSFLALAIMIIVVALSMYSVGINKQERQFVNNILTKFTKR